MDYVSFRKADIFAVLTESDRPLAVREIAVALRAWKRNYVPAAAMIHLTSMLNYYVKVGYLLRIRAPHKDAQGILVKYAVPS